MYLASIAGAVGDGPSQAGSSGERVRTNHQATKHQGEHTMDEPRTYLLWELGVRMRCRPSEPRPVQFFSQFTARTQLGVDTLGQPPQSLRTIALTTGHAHASRSAAGRWQR